LVIYILVIKLQELIIFEVETDVFRRVYCNFVGVDHSTSSNHVSSIK